MVLPELPMEVGQLLIKLAPSLGELVEARPALGIDDAVLLQVGGATRGRHHGNKALTRGVVHELSRCPPGPCGAEGGVGRSQRVHVGRHRVVREAWLSTSVHHGVPLHEFLPGEWLSFAGLEGEVGEVVGGEPKMLLRWVWPQHGHDRLAREASDECRVSRCLRRDIGTGRPGEGTPGDGLRRPGLDEVEGVETHGGPRG
jgi:hypothetical protein